MPAALDNIRVVLVEPQHSGNIGAVARAMKNMALSRLVLVNPADHLAMEARMMAMHALDILQQAQVVDTLTQAIADAGYVVGTTRRLGRSRQAQQTSRSIAPLLLELAASNPVALVFGREDSGLTNDELARCHELITIPAHPTFGSLNLAQAVLLVCYELYVSAGASLLRPLHPRHDRGSRTPLRPHAGGIAPRRIFAWLQPGSDDGLFSPFLRPLRPEIARCQSLLGGVSPDRMVYQSPSLTEPGSLQDFQLDRSRHFTPPEHLLKVSLRHAIGVKSMLTSQGPRSVIVTERPFYRSPCPCGGGCGGGHGGTLS